jgi:hypothetical protein
MLTNWFPCHLLRCFLVDPEQSKRHVAADPVGLPREARPRMAALKMLLVACVLASVLAGAAQAVTIVPTFDSSFGAAPDVGAAESAVQAAIATVDSLYATPGTIPVLFRFDPSVTGFSQNALVTSSYDSWLGRLAAISAANPGQAVLSTAVASLPASGTVSQPMGFTAPYANLIMGQGLFLGFDASGTYHNQGGQSFAAVVTLGSSNNTSSPGFNAPAAQLAEHELDEVLGGGGAGTWIGSGESLYGATDFYRYLSGNGTDGSGTLGPRTWSASASIRTYFSINGGSSAVVDQQGNPIGFNQAGNGSDYGDFAGGSGFSHIQDAFYAGPAPLYTVASPEATMMEAIGYVVPEPTTVTLLGGMVAGLAFRRPGRRASRDKFDSRDAFN